MRFQAAIIAGCIIALLAYPIAATFQADLSAADKTEKWVDFRVAVVPSTDQPFDPAVQIGKPAAKIRRGQIAKLIIEVRVRPGHYSYPLTARTAAQAPSSLWKFRPAQVEGLAALWPIEETPEPVRANMIDENKKAFVGLKHTKPFFWIQDVLVLPEASPGEVSLPIKLVGNVCDKDYCNRIDTAIRAVFAISEESPLPIDEKLAAQRRKDEKPAAKIVADQIESPHAAAAPHGPQAAAPAEGVFGLISKSEDEYRQTMENWQIVGESGIGATDASVDLWAFIVSGMFWGAISLVTPCVFPMIPITVSVFLKQSEKEHHRPVVMALVYSGTIVLVLTLAAAFLLSVLQRLSVNPYMNYALGGLFVFFALSLFGMYDIELPSGLARFTSSHESQGGYLGIVFMALTFTIISFACVAPFLGGFGGTSAGTSRPMLHNILGGLAFSVTFAAPFFFLALFPTLLRKMPKSGSWLNTVKVVMGFLELAAAVKFCRSAELVLTKSEPWLLTFDLGLGIYVVLFLLCGAYLIGLYRLPYDTPQEHLTAPRLMFAAVFLTVGIYLIPALFKDAQGYNVRPQGTLFAWIESFLLPDSVHEGSHTPDLSAAVAEAQRLSVNGRPQRIFIDFTGTNCQNCRLNEQYVFSKASIQELLKSYVIAKIYTDAVPAKCYTTEWRASLGKTERDDADARVNREFQDRIGKSTQLPQYAIIEPRGDNAIRIVSVYREGRINDEAGFAEFLRDPK